MMRNLSIGRWLALVALAAMCGCSHSSAPGASNSANSASTGSAASSASDNSAQNTDADSPAPPPAPAPIVISAGKVLTVTLDQDVSTKTSNSGDQFDASLAEPVRVDGQTVLPAGTKAVGTIVQAKSAGHLKGDAVLELRLDGLRLHGERYGIETSQFEEASKGRGKRSLIGGGGGAAFGAIVGALAGGGKGAAVGALAGGGAGTAGAAYTGKRDINLPAETRLHFRLERSLTIQP
jgi:hypothetical protein